MEITALSTKDTKKLACELAAKLKPGMVLALHGDLGSGKTTFTGFLVKELGFDSRVQSPTFVIIRKYKKHIAKSAVKNIYHIDLYRLTNKAELSDLDLNELFAEKDSLSILEWPDVATDMLPADTIHIYFDYLGEQERYINVQNLD